VHRALHLLCGGPALTSLAQALQRIRRNLERSVTSGAMQQAEMEDALAPIHSTTDVRVRTSGALRAAASPPSPCLPLTECLPFRPSSALSSSPHASPVNSSPAQEMRDVGFLVEAISEDELLKRSVFAELDRVRRCRVRC